MMNSSRMPWRQQIVMMLGILTSMLCLTANRQQPRHGAEQLQETTGQTPICHHTGVRVYSAVAQQAMAVRVWEDWKGGLSGATVCPNGANKYPWA